MSHQLNRSIRNGAWINAVPHRINNMELSVMVEVKSDLLIRTYNVPKEAFFWRGMITMQISRVPFKPDP